MTYGLAADTWGDEEKMAIASVVDSGHLTMGEKVAEFEQAFAKYFGGKYAVMLNSGSSANLVSVASLFYLENNPLMAGDEVIVPAIAWSTTYHPLQQYGLKLKFVDIELDSLNIDISELEAAISSKTRMILGVSVLGNPAALDVLRSIADAHGLIFFEDNCESMDAELFGKKAGSFGDLGTFSSFFSHHISTIEGGYILTDDRELNDLARSIRAHGWTRDLQSGTSLFQPRDDEFFEDYRFILPGYNLRPQEINAAIGIEQLKKLPKFTKARRRNLAHFKSLFYDDERFITQKENGKSSSFCFTIILNPLKNIDRSKVTKALRDSNIEFRMITGGAFPLHEVIKYFDYELHGDMTNAILAHEQGFFVGNHPFDLTDEINNLYSILDQF